MTPLHDKLRAALRETADEIPADAPPLLLSPQERIRRIRRDPRPRWRAWATPLAAAALVVAVIAAAVAVAGGMKHQQNTSAPASPEGLPPYYVALATPKPNWIYALGATAAELRSTQTGALLAKVAPPKPYISFTGVTGAADDRTFVLSAQGADESPTNPPAKQYPDGYFLAVRFFLLRISPGASPGHRMSLTALPAAYTPAGYAIRDMALSPDGTELAADVGGQSLHGHLYGHFHVFDLATGTERAWSALTCSTCFPIGSVNVDALSWTADSQHVAFIWGNTVRLLDIRAPGSNIVTDSKTVAAWTPNGPTRQDLWRGAIITPDGQTVLGIEEIEGLPVASLPEHLVRFSTATGRQTGILNTLDALKLLGYQQVIYTNATGSVLVIGDMRPWVNATILHNGQFTPLPWSPYIGTAAW